MLILASTSPIRQQLLRQSGIAFASIAPLLDEESAKLSLGPQSPNLLPAELAKAKALSVNARYSSSTIIGADQTLEITGQIIHKAKDFEQAKQNLKFLRGKTHLLHSAVAVTRASKILYETTQTASLTMRNFSDEFLDSYLLQQNQQIYKSPGCYQIESSGLQLFEAIHGDYFTILGLPLLPLLSFLRAIGEIPA